MAGKIQPLNVSPLIKCARYSFLILGYFYGSFRLSALRISESKARVFRHKMLHEKEERKKMIQKEETIKGVTDMARELDVIELVPSWESEL